MLFLSSKVFSSDILFFISWSPIVSFIVLLLIFVFYLKYLGILINFNILIANSISLSFLGLFLLTDSSPC